MQQAKKIRFSKFINASPEKVWDTMLGDATYRQWTKAFNETSRYEGNWEKGTKMRFLGTDSEGKGEGGMVSRVAENRKPEYVSIEHLGLIKDGVEDTTSEEATKWAPAFENYTFNKKNGGTELIVEMDTNSEYEKMFKEMWPKALDKLKELCEK